MWAYSSTCSVFSKLFPPLNERKTCSIVGVFLFFIQSKRIFHYIHPLYRSLLSTKLFLSINFADNIAYVRIIKFRRPMKQCLQHVWSPMSKHSMCEIGVRTWFLSSGKAAASFVHLDRNSEMAHVCTYNKSIKYSSLPSSAASSVTESRRISILSNNLYAIIGVTDAYPYTFYRVYHGQRSGGVCCLSQL